MVRRVDGKWDAFARFDTGDIDANGVARVAMFAAELRTKSPTRAAARRTQKNSASAHLRRTSYPWSRVGLAERVTRHRGGLRYASLTESKRRGRSGCESNN